jgi:hypothetical protein
MGYMILIGAYSSFLIPVTSLAYILITLSMTFFLLHPLFYTSYTLELASFILIILLSF